MATQSQINSFISKISVCAKNSYKLLGKVKPSVCIAMACVESAYGTSGSCKYNSYLGQKVGTGKTATKYWNKGFFTSSTSEEYTIGTHTVIKAAFRSYDNIQQCVNNYYELLNTKLYSKVLSTSTYAEQMLQIKSVGYMTSSTEVASVLYIIKKYNLTQYDKDENNTLSIGDKVTLLNKMNIRKGPGINYEIVGSLEKSKTIIVSQIHKIDNYIWIGCAYGYICYSNGKTQYIK